MAVTCTTSTRSSSDHLGDKSSAVNQHSTKMATNIGNQNKPQQIEIYSEPQTIKNAWKSFGCDDNEGKNPSLLNPWMSDNFFLS